MITIYLIGGVGFCSKYKAPYIPYTPYKNTPLLLLVIYYNYKNFRHNTIYPINPPPVIILFKILIVTLE